MSTEGNATGLAAVMEAAGAVSRADHDAAIARTRTETQAAARAEGETAGRTEGASAERARITGILAHGRAMPGHDALVAEMIADANVSVDAAAGRILAAEGASRDTRAQAIRDVEKHTAAARSAPLASGGAVDPQAPKASTPDGWKAEFAASAELQGEFTSADAYAAFKAAEASGRVKILQRKAS
jgi:hypothetical protein